MEQNQLRNLAIIAHVDHGKTTLVDCMLKQSGVFHEKQVVEDRVMDSNDLERERGITIMSKNTAIFYKDMKFNIVDTPGHADFGGEVERIVQIVDGVLLVVDAVEGPMPQTRFVLGKALEAGLKPVVVINKVDRPNARPSEVVDEILELFIDLGADDEQLEFPTVFASAQKGTASLAHEECESGSLEPLFEMIAEYIPCPRGDKMLPLQLGVTLVSYDTYLGRQAIGRISNGVLKNKQAVTVINADHQKSYRKEISGLFSFEGLKKVPVSEASTGDIVVVSGLDPINVGDTIACSEHPVPLDFVAIDQPTVSMKFQVNKSPFAGREGKFVTSRKLNERLFRETESDVALQVVETDSPDAFNVFGRGELHLGILIEKMRREGFEFEVSRPQVVLKEVDGIKCEPIEELVIEVPEQYMGSVMENLGQRRVTMQNMVQKQDGIVRLVYDIATRGLFGFRSEFLTDTKGEGIMYHSFKGYEPFVGDIETRNRGALVAFEGGESNAYGLENAQERGGLFIGVGVPVYKGMIVGENSRGADLAINVCKKKHLTNIRSSTSDVSVKLTPPKNMSLEQCLQFISDDELLEVTPQNLRMRKK